MNEDTLSFWCYALTNKISIKFTMWSSADLKLNDLEIVEGYRRRQSFLETMAQNKCHKCPKLQEHFSLMKTQHTLKERVKQLKFELSDAALQQMPDFQQRVMTSTYTDVNCVCCI